MHKQKVSVSVQAIEMGQHGGVLRHPTQKFTYNGLIINGRFPRWVKCLDEEFKSEFSKLDKEDQEAHLSQEPAKELKAENQLDLAKLKAQAKAEAKAELEAELEADRESMKAELRKELEAEMAAIADAHNGDQGEPSDQPQNSAPSSLV